MSPFAHDQNEITRLGVLGNFYKTFVLQSPHSYSVSNPYFLDFHFGHLLLALIALRGTQSV